MQSNKFISIEDLDRYLRDNLYINKTADPTNTNYLYLDMLHQIEYFGQFVVDKRNLTILAYDKKYYYRTDLIDIFPENANISFEKSPYQMTLGDLLQINQELRD